MFFWGSPIMQLPSSQNLTCTWSLCHAMPKQSSWIRPGCKGTCTAPGTQQCSQKLDGVQGPRLHPTQCLLAMPLTPQSLSTTRTSLRAQKCLSHSVPPTAVESGNTKTIRWPHLLWMRKVPETDSSAMLCNSTAPGKAQPVAWAQTKKDYCLRVTPTLISPACWHLEFCSSILHELVWSKTSHLSSSL